MISSASFSNSSGCTSHACSHKSVGYAVIIISCSMLLLHAGKSVASLVDIRIKINNVYI